MFISADIVNHNKCFFPIQFQLINAAVNLYALVISWTNHCYNMKAGPIV